MIYVHGRYFFGRKRIGYRNDYCLTCDTTRVSELYRTFDMWHFCFIPLIPLGIWKRWECTECRQNPHARVDSSKSFRTLVVFAFGFFTGFAWIVGELAKPEKTDDMAFMWGFRIVMTACFLAALAWLAKGREPVDLSEKLAAVPPLSSKACIYCEGKLDDSKYCSACQVTRYDINL